MAIHVSIDGLTEDLQPTVAEFVDRLERLQPASITVDSAGVGRVLLAALQTRGLPAHALEKRPRPTLPEIQHAEALSKEVATLKAKLEQQEQEFKQLRDYQRDIRILLNKIDYG
jgi:hypothetical protein